MRIVKGILIGLALGAVFSVFGCVMSASFVSSVPYLMGFMAVYGAVCLSGIHNKEDYVMKGKYEATVHNTDEGTGTQIAILKDILEKKDDEK